LTFVLLSTVSFAQKGKQEMFTVYYDAKQNEISEEEWNELNDSVTSYGVASKQGKITYLEKYKTLNNKLISKGSYSDKLRTVKTGTWFYYDNDTLTEEANYAKGLLEGLSTCYYRSGKVHFLTNYQRGKLHGSLKSFYESGMLKREDFYTSGNFDSGKCFDDHGNEMVYYDLDTPAQFPGGNDAMNLYLKENIKYGICQNPDSAPVKVVIRFVVTEDGKISNARAVKSGGVCFDELALKVVKEMPDWVPGTYDGDPLNQWFNLPVTFK
jgi:TonB family protein